MNHKSLGGLSVAGCLLVALLVGCAPVDAPEAAAPSATAEETAPVAPPPPPETARSIEEFDTTSADQRSAARADAATDGELLGEVVVSLGDPAQPGFWVQTDLVEDEQPGRAELTGGDGAAVEVDLLPGDGPARMSLAAMRVLGLAITDLVEVVLYAR